jgi:hypothetical protein
MRLDGRIVLSVVAAIVLPLWFHGTAAVAKPPGAPPNLAGAHGFDFEFGQWRVHHRVLRPDGTWVEFEGTSVDRPIMGGAANVEDNVFHRAGGDTRGVAMRAYDAKLDEWAIWWVDGRNPLASLDPPVRGRFTDGVGTFYADGILNGKQTRTRYIWSKITPASARWEQALSEDGGKTWDTNWIMEFRRK